MRYPIVASAIFAAVLSGTTAMAQEKTSDGWYGQVSLGVLIPEDQDYSFSTASGSINLANGVSLHGAVGYRWASGFRLEGELAYAQSELDGGTINNTAFGLSGDIDIFSGTVGAYYDFSRGTTLSPYIGAGAGFATISSDAATVTANGSTLRLNGGSETKFTAFAELGVGIRIAPKTEIVPSFRYQYINTGENGFDDAKAGTLKVGLRFEF